MDGFVSSDKSMQEVYLAKAANGLFKIGVSSNSRARIKGLNNQSPIDIELVAAYRFGCISEKIEVELQRMFDSKKVKYEWFRLIPEDIERFRSYCVEQEAKRGRKQAADQ